MLKTVMMMTAMMMTAMMMTAMMMTAMIQLPTQVREHLRGTAIKLIYNYDIGITYTDMVSYLSEGGRAQWDRISYELMKRIAAFLVLAKISRRPFF